MKILKSFLHVSYLFLTNETLCLDACLVRVLEGERTRYINNRSIVLT